MRRHALALILSAGISLVFSSSAALAQYQLTNLTSNQFKQANHDDPLIVNGWGLARAGGSPWWVSDNGSGWSTLYNQGGIKQGLVVEIPAANGGVGSPTGLVSNGSQEFPVQGSPSLFIFATMDGTISGWSPQSDVNNAIIAVNNSASKASYTGLAITNKAAGNFLFAADNANNKVDIYDGTFKPVGTFAADPDVPAGFSVFGIRDFNGQVLVSYASNSGGPGGFVDIYSESGVLLTHFASGAPLNQPWGFALAPKNFGPLSNTLLVSNNTNRGTIVAFNGRGQFVGAVKDASGNVIQIDQLWAIDFGGGTTSNGATNELFFTAGPDGNVAGTFGSIRLK
jgi:uncharacterized protein (TIGR03118 family)